MASQKPFFALHTSHSVDINLNIHSDTSSEVWELLKALHERLTNQEESMRQVKTLLRELREGLDALRVGEDQEDLEAAALDETQKARIAELEALVAELKARPTLTPAERDTLEAMVVELAERTGNVITDDEDQTVDTDGNEPTLP